MGWGVWCIETGWIQTWITSTLALRHMKTSLWDLMPGSGIAASFAQHRPAMLPDEALNVGCPSARQVQACGGEETSAIDGAAA